MNKKKKKIILPMSHFIQVNICQGTLIQKILEEGIHGKKFSVVILCSKSCFKHKHTTGAEYQVLKLKTKYNYNFFFIVFHVGFPKIVPLLLSI